MRRAGKRGDLRGSWADDRRLTGLGRTESEERLVRVLSRVVAGADFALAGASGLLLQGVGKAAVYSC